MAKNKFYVVWKGGKPGVYASWSECQAQINGFSGAQFQGYPSRATADAAFRSGPPKPSGTSSKPAKGKNTSPRTRSVIRNSISVDAACSGNPGPMEYQGVMTDDRRRIFHQKFPLGTNNIGEFLAIVHALALLKKQDNDSLPIYTDSKIAMGWVAKKKCKTTLVRNAKTAKLYEYIERAEKWLKTNSYNNPILKWPTKTLGEIPADFGRK